MSALRPRVLRSAAAASWRERWNLGALAAEPLQVTAKRSPSPSFMYVAEGRRDTLLPDLSAPQGEVEVTLSAAELVAAVRSGGPPFYYFTSPVEALAPSLLERAPGWEQLAAPTDAPPSGRPWLQLWTASAGAFTQAHYDVADNYFVQCDGVKEFWLWPPAAADALHVFPDAHPRARKAQRDVVAALAAASPADARAEATRRALFPGRSPTSALPPPYRLTLSPGQALYVPAFWFHHVVSSSPTLSLNVFAPSDTAAAAAACLAQPLPLSPHWPAPVLRSAVATLLDRILAAGVVCGGFVSGGNVMSLGVLAAGGETRARLIERLLATRYAPLPKPPMGGGGDRAEEAGEQGRKGGGDGGVGGAAGRRRPPRAPPPRLEETVLAMVEDHARELTALFDALREAIVAQQQAGGAADEALAWQDGEGYGGEGPTAGAAGDGGGAADGVSGCRGDGIFTATDTTAVVSVHPAAPRRYTAWEHYEGVAALLVAHLLEMWALRLFGSPNIEEELRAIAGTRPLAKGEDGLGAGE